MNLLNFSTIFPDESSCKAKWKAMRDKKGVVCPHCGSMDHYWKSDKDAVIDSDDSTSYTMIIKIFLKKN